MDRAFRLAPSYLKEELGDAFDYIGRKFLKTFRAERLQGPPGVRGTTHGIWKRIKRTMLIPYGGILDMGTEISVESNVAQLHEEGGTVTAPGGGSLAVPLSARTEMFTGQGALRATYKHPGQLRNVRLVVLKGKRFLARFWKSKDEIRPLYVLKNQVTIRPRLGFYDTWRTMENLNIDRVNRALSKAIGRI